MTSNSSFKDKECKREVSFLEKSDHPNIAKYLGQFPIKDDFGDERTGIAMEGCEGTVKDLVKKRRLNLLEVAYLTRQLLTGMQYLHDVLKIHHRYQS